MLFTSLPLVKIFWTLKKLRLTIGPIEPENNSLKVRLKKASAAQKRMGSGDIRLILFSSVHGNLAKEKILMNDIH